MIDMHVPTPSSHARRALLALLALSCTSAPGPAPTPAPVPAVETPAPAPAPQWRMAQGRMMTRWAASVSPDNALPEYPRPQMARPRWHTLNGVWEFAVVTDSTAPLAFGQSLPERILVPFAMESAISGIMRHAQRVTYRRTFRRPATNAGERLLLHFDAVDWRARVYLNGRQLGEHAARAGDRGAARRRIVSVAGVLEIFAQVAPIRGRQPIGCPPERGAHRVQNREWNPRGEAHQEARHLLSFMPRFSGAHAST